MIDGFCVVDLVCCGCCVVWFLALTSIIERNCFGQAQTSTGIPIVLSAYRLVYKIPSPNQAKIIRKV